MNYATKTKPTVYISSMHGPDVVDELNSQFKRFDVVFLQSHEQFKHNLTFSGGIFLLFGSKDVKMHVPNKHVKDLKQEKVVIDGKFKYVLADEIADEQSLVRLLFSPVINECTFKTIQIKKDYADALKYLKGVEEVTLDIETAGLDPFHPEAKILTVAFGDTKTVMCMPVSHSDLLNASISDIQKLTIDVFKELAKKRIIAHNAKYEMRWMERHAFLPNGIAPTMKVAFDTMLAHYMLEENSSHGLDSLTNEYFPQHSGYWNMVELFRTKNESYELVPLWDLCIYNMADVYITAALVDGMRSKLRLEDMLELYENYMIPLIHTVSVMETNGFSINEKELSRLTAWYENKKEKAERLIADVIGHRINMASSKQVSTLLYDELELPVLQYTEKGGRSTDEDTINQLLKAKKLDVERKSVLEQMLVHRKCSTMLKSFLSVFRDRVESSTDGLLRTNYNLHIVETGRLSSSNPNLQNIPTSPSLTEHGYEPIKTVFNSRYGKTGYIITADYGQMELRVAAMYSKDPVFMRAFKENRDLHGEMAEYVYGPKFTLEQRDKAKRTNFSAVFDIQPETLAKKIDLTVPEATKLLTAFRSLHPRLYYYFDSVWERSRSLGYATNYLGRRRHIKKDIEKATELWQMERIKRQVWNFPIQSSAVEIALTGIMLLRRELTRNKLHRSLIISNVHDSVVLDVPKDELDDALELVSTVLTKGVEQVYEWISVPLKLDVKYGHDMHNADKA